VTKLAIGEGLSLPAEAVTQTFGIIAVRGVGKTYTAAAMVEEMVEAKLPVVVVDPVGVWWGLRSSADGNRPGLPVIILGGEHADVPLEVTAGAVVADFVIESRQPTVIDLSLFRKGEQVRFMTDFAERLYLKNREALHLVIDEADAFAPQKPQKGAERLLGAIEDLVRRGRARGLGLTLITQRAAVLNKNVLTQISVLVALRTVSPQDRAAIDEWVRAHGAAEKREQMMASLPSLPIGTAWFWSPGWLDLFQRVKVRARRTLDSSATPKVGAARVTPKALAEVDLTALRARLEETIERTKADDPAALKKRIAELEKQLAAAPTKTERVEVPVLTPTEIAVLDDVRKELKRTASCFEVLVVRTQTASGAPIVHRDLKPTNLIHESPPTEHHAHRDHKPEKTPRPAPAPKATCGTADVRSGARHILATAARHHPQRLSRDVLAARSGMVASGGTFATYLGDLKRGGYLADDLSVTERGIACAGVKPRTPMVREEVLAQWTKKLRAGARKMLTKVIEYGPLTRDELASAVEMEASGGTFATYIGDLRRPGLITSDRGRIALGPALEGTR
jgi:hypothetical protein